MLEYSTTRYAVQAGGRVVDLDTGEILTAPAIPVRGSGAEGGLSNPHICTRENRGSLTVYLGGGLLQVKKPKSSIPGNLGGGVRGEISTFSAGSKRRLLYTFGKIQRSALPVMITLTYPEEFSTESQVWKNDLRKFWQRLERLLPVGCVWKLEPQKRGAPHFHMLVWGLDRVPLYDLRVWISKAWYEVVGSCDLKHLRAGTKVETVRSWRGVMAYASKYLGKVLNDLVGWDQPGRFWGVKGSKNIPWAKMFSMGLTMRQCIKLLRYMRRYMHCKRGCLPSLTMLCNNPDFWFDNINFLST